MVILNNLSTPIYCTMFTPSRDTDLTIFMPWMSDLDPQSLRIAPNKTNRGLFRSSTLQQKCAET